MEQEKYAKNLQKVRAWMNENDAGAMAPVLEAQMALPAETEQDRDRLWQAIRAIAAMLPNSPIKKGRGSSLPVEVQTLIDAISHEYGVEMGLAWNAGDNRYLMRKHGKSGGGLFANQDEVLETHAAKMASDLKRRFNDGIWDGTREGLHSQTFPVQEVNEEE